SVTSVTDQSTHADYGPALARQFSTSMAVGTSANLPVSLPHESHPGRVWRANSSSLGRFGNILSMTTWEASGFRECSRRRSRITDACTFSVGGRGRLPLVASNNSSCWPRTQYPKPGISLSQTRPDLYSKPQALSTSNVFSHNGTVVQRNSTQSLAASSAIGSAQIASRDITG